MLKKKKVLEQLLCIFDAS